MSSITKSLADMSISRESKDIGKAYIYDIDASGNHSGNQNKDNKRVQLQYFPETISMGRGVEYSAKKTLGSSHPIYQWLHGAERSLSFKTVFSRDTPPIKHEALKKKSGPGGIGTTDYADITTTAQDRINAAGNYIKNPASAFLAQGISSPVGDEKYDAGFNNADGDDGIEGKIQWLLSKTYPEYYAGSRVNPPPLLGISMPNSGITSYIGGLQEQGIFFGLMTRCDVEYITFFRDGTPRLVEVNLTFEESIQVGTNWGFVSRSQVYSLDKAKDDPKTTKNDTYSGTNLQTRLA